MVAIAESVQVLPEECDLESATTSRARKLEKKERSTAASLVGSSLHAFGEHSGVLGRMDTSLAGSSRVTCGFSFTVDIYFIPLSSLSG